MQTCFNYYKDTLIENSLTTRVAVLITLINILVKTVISNMIESLSFNTRSKETRFAIIAVFLCQFFSTIAILVVTDTSLFK